MNGARQQVTKLSLSKRQRVITAIVALLILIGAYPVFWLIAASELRNQLLSDIERYHLGYGFDVSWDRLELAGFPESVDLVIHGLQFSIADQESNAQSLQFAPVTMQTQPWPGTPITIDLSGVHLASLTLGDTRYEVSIDIDSFLFSAVMDRQGRLNKLSYDAQDVIIRAMTGKPILKIGLVNQQNNLDFDNDDGQKVGHLSWTVQDIGWLSETGQMFDPLLDRFNMDIIQYGYIYNHVHRPHNLDLRRWRRDGGKILLENIVARQGPLELTASATIDLDEDLQVRIEAVAHIKGLSAFVEEKKRGHSRIADTTEYIKNVLQDYAEPLEGRDDAMTLNLRLADRWIYIGNKWFVELDEPLTLLAWPIDP